MVTTRSTKLNLVPFVQLATTALSTQTIRSGALRDSPPQERVLTDVYLVQLTSLLIQTPISARLSLQDTIRMHPCSHRRSVDTEITVLQTPSPVQALRIARRHQATS